MGSGPFVFIFFQIDESGVAKFRDETLFIHACLLLLFRILRAIALSILMLTRFSVVLYLLKACLLPFIACAHCAFHHRVNLRLLVFLVLGIAMLAASIVASISRSSAMFMLLKLIGFSSNWEYEFVSDSRYSSQLVS